MIRIGVDLGGTNLRAARVGADHAIVAAHRELVGEPRDVDSIVARVALAIEQLADVPEAHAPIFDDDPGEVVAVGVGIAAMLRGDDGTVANSPHLRWRDQPFGARLAARLGPRFRVGVYNDANAVVWGEVVAGAARGCRDVLGVYVGTGIGAGVVCNGRLVAGASHTAGELGHAKVRWDDDAEPCRCGSRGCVEAYLGGSYLDRAVRRDLAARPKQLARVVALAGGAELVTLAHVDAAAGEGDAYALELWEQRAPLLAVALGNALAVLNSERLVLGGGVLSRCPVLLDHVVTTLHVAAPAACVEKLSIVAAALGDDAGLVGAADLATMQP
nr:ROK family protein [Kofleriaceae bacterium]